MNILGILDAALKTRFKQIELKFNNEHEIILGVNVIREKVFATKILGPMHGETEAVEQFQGIWGDSAQSVRQPNGTYCMQIIFPKEDHPDKILSNIVQHLLTLHLGLPSDAIEMFGERLWEIGFVRKNALHRREAEETFQKLQSKLFELNLPLHLTNIHATHTLFRISAFSIPKRVPREEYSDDFGSSLPVLPIIAELHASSKWPEDSLAIERIKSAFYIKIAKQLRVIHKVRSIASQTFVDITHEGYIFRLKIFYQRELLVRQVQEKPYKEMRQELQFLPKHVTLIRTVGVRFQSFPMAIRLCKQWCRCHFFAISEEIIELLLAYVYVHPEPFVCPQTSFCGFQRFLHLIHTFNWSTTPLVIDIMEEITAERYKKIDKELQAWRESQKIGKEMYIITHRDLKSEHFTEKIPTKVELGRLREFARATEKQLHKLREKFTLEDNQEQIIKSLFKTPLSSYDAFLTLQSSKINDYESYIFKTNKGLKRKRKAHEQGVVKRRKIEKSAFPLCDFNIRNLLMNDLNECFGNICEFKTNNLGSDLIVLKWKEKLTKEQKNEILMDINEIGKGALSGIYPSHLAYLGRRKKKKIEVK